MKAVIYIRVSTEEQAKENRTSLTFQREQCEEYCQRMGHEVWEVVVDPGYSGLSLDTPGLQRIQELAQTEAFVYYAEVGDILRTVAAGHATFDGAGVVRAGDTGGVEPCCSSRTYQIQSGETRHSNDINVMEVQFLGQRCERVDQGPALAQKEYQEADLPF